MAVVLISDLLMSCGGESALPIRIYISICLEHNLFTQNNVFVSWTQNGNKTDVYRNLYDLSITHCDMKVLLKFALKSSSISILIQRYDLVKMYIIIIIHCTYHCLMLTSLWLFDLFSSSLQEKRKNSDVTCEAYCSSINDVAWIPQSMSSDFML